MHLQLFCRYCQFQLTAARRRLAACKKDCGGARAVSTHSRPKAAGKDAYDIVKGALVSTHSRPKAAGRALPAKAAPTHRFNSQPPEGGWASSQLKE